MKLLSFPKKIRVLEQGSSGGLGPQKKPQKKANVCYCYSYGTSNHGRTEDSVDFNSRD